MLPKNSPAAVGLRCLALSMGCGSSYLLWLTMPFERAERPDIQIDATRFRVCAEMS
jgi:hypothetical protein